VHCDPRSVSCFHSSLPTYLTEVARVGTHASYFGGLRFESLLETGCPKMILIVFVVLSRKRRSVVSSFFQINHSLPDAI
jgi:hypothetical protein